MVIAVFPQWVFCITSVSRLKNCWKSGHWNSSPLFCPILEHSFPQLFVGAFPIPFKYLPFKVKPSKRMIRDQINVERSQRKPFIPSILIVPPEAWKRQTILMWDKVQSKSIWNPNQTGFPLGRGIFKTDFEISHRRRKKASDRQMHHISHVFQLNIPTVACLSYILYTGI